MLAEQDKLHTVWAKKMQQLDDLYNQQAFLRDAHQLDVLSTSQEVRLNAVALCFGVKWLTKSFSFHILNCGAVP